ncbi:uncharacterized protein LOC135106908 isoform X2 [Scylla paramamosain]|uniref:uncharacterized protein LOC135106908 isoform X2 n=1 Tax=Scylla paramamosain TaxID=85552 RepID=UPI003082C84A
MLILLHTFWYLQHVTLLPFISSGACIPDILGWIGMLQAPVLLSPSAAAGRGSTWLDKYIRCWGLSFHLFSSSPVKISPGFYFLDPTSAGEILSSSTTSVHSDGW